MEKNSSNTEKKGKSINMTEGDPYRIILRFALPIFLTTILQQFYNMVDTAVAGNILGDNALSAIGAVGAVYHIIITFAQGMNTGFSLLISRAFGTRDRDGVNRAVVWTVVLNLILVVILTAGALVFIDPILGVMNIPDEIYTEAKIYLAVICAGIPVTMAYNMGASVLRSIGNSSTPLYALIISSLLNFLLNVLFVKWFGMGVAGLALGTVGAQLLSAAFCIVYILSRYPDIRYRKDHLHPEKGYVSEMFLTGLSMGLMSMIVSFGGAVLQSAVNGLGSIYIAGQIGGSKIEVFFMCMITSIAMSISTFVSQNYGAGKRRRILQGIRATFMYCICGCVICYAFALSPLAPIAMRLITGSENTEIIQSGTRFIRVSLFFSPFLSIVLILRSTMQGMGHKIAPLVTSAIEMGGKILFAHAFVPRYGYPAVCYCEPSMWVMCSVYLVIVMFIFRYEFTEKYNDDPADKQIITE